MHFIRSTDYLRMRMFAVIASLVGLSMWDTLRLEEGFWLRVLEWKAQRDHAAGSI